MKLTADECYLAALDHVDEAQLLYDGNKYVLAHYVAGLAVECMFRAYAVRNGEPFEARHDLNKCLELARFDDVIAPSRSEAVAASYSVVVTQWNSTQRYFSDGFLKAYFRNAGLNRGIKGDPVKELTRRIVEAASIVVTEGRVRWTIWSKR